MTKSLKDCYSPNVPKRTVLNNTMNTAVATSTASEVLSCPNSRAGRRCSTATPNGFGQGARIRKVRGVTVFTLLTPCPPYVLNNTNGGFKSHTGANHAETHAQNGLCPQRRRRVDHLRNYQISANATHHIFKCAGRNRTHKGLSKKFREHFR